MKVCSECGKEVDSSFKFCPYCFTDFAPEDEEKNLEEIDSIQAEEEETPEEDESNNTSNSFGSSSNEVRFSDKYILEEPLACSATGTVCIVRHYKNDRLYILKDFRIVNKTKEEREIIGDRLMKTTNALKRLQHNNLSCVIDSDFENDTFSVIYEYQTGKSVLDHIEEIRLKSDKPSKEKVIKWAESIVEILVFFQQNQKRPFCCCNMLPYSFVITDNEDIKYINIGMPIFYKEIGIDNPFEERPLLDSEISPKYDIYCAGLTLLYIISGIQASSDPRLPVPEIPKNADVPELHPIIKKMLNIYHALIAPSELLEEIRNIGKPKEEKKEEIKEEKCDWSIYLGNSERTNAFGNHPTPFLKLNWSIMVGPSSRFYIQPAENALTVLSDKGNLYLLNFTKAQLIKRYVLNINAVPPVTDGKIMYINSATGQTAVDFEKNEPLWDFRTKSMFLTPPNITDKTIMTISYDGFMVQVNPLDGKPVSMESLKGKVMAPVIFDSSRLYIPTLSHGLLAVNRETRIVEWEVKASSFTSPVSLSNGKVYAGDGAGNVYCVEAHSGRVIWTSSIKGAVVHGPVISENMAISSSAMGQIVAMNKDTGETLWKIDFASKSNPVFCVSDKYLFLTSPEHTILTANIDNGTIYRQIKLKGKANSIPLVYKGRLYCSSDEGEIYSFTPRED